MSTTYGYDALNRVIETVDANGNVTRYTYDAGRPCHNSDRCYG